MFRARFAVVYAAVVLLALSVAPLAHAQTVPEDTYGAGAGVAGARVLPSTGDGSLSQPDIGGVALYIVVAAAACSGGLLLRHRLLAQPREREARSASRGRLVS